MQARRIVERQYLKNRVTAAAAATVVACVVALVYSVADASP